MKKEMKRNILTAVFANDSEAYKALSEFRRDSVNGDYVIANAALVKKQGQQLSVLDGFDTGTESRNHTSSGWMIGMLVGMLGGIFGILLGGWIGSVIGSFRDSRTVRRNSAMMQEAARSLPDGETALVLLVAENGEEAINARLAHYELTLERTDAEIMEEIVKAAEAEKKAQKKNEKMSGQLTGTSFNS